MGLTEQNRWKNGGSCKKYTYTTKNISNATSRVPGTIRNDIASGKLNMDDIKSVSRYIVKHLKEK